MISADSPASGSVAPAEAFAELAARIEGAVTTPADAGWDAARQAWNVAADQRPDAVIAPLSAADVQAAIRFAEQHQLRVVAQSTGHMAAPLGDLSGSILLRTAGLSSIDVDPAALTVRVGAGALWADVTAALAEHGLMGLAGSAPDVGVAGYLLGGGVSWFARSHGLATSHVTEIEAVTGDGRVLRANADEETELFHALRGGGGNYAVVTAITMRAFAVRDAYAGMLLFPLERADEVLTAWEAWTHEIDETATTSLRLLRLPPLPELPEFLRGQRFVAIDGAIAVEQADGTADAAASDDERSAAAAATLAPLRALGPIVDTFGLMPVGRLGEVHMDPPGPVPGGGDGANLIELPRAAIERIVALAGADVDSPLLAVEIRHLGGALAVRATGGGAVDSLHGRFLIYAVGITPTPEAAAMVASATTAVLDATKEWHSGIDYVNFRESRVAPERLYPAATLTRLRAAKQQYDPAGRIHSAHPVH